MQHISYRKDIDGLRAIAVIAVIIFHFFPKVIRGGFLGVDVFFVISGFLISGIIFKSLDKKEFTFADFYARRIRRILPALITVLIFCLGIGWFILLPSEYMALGKNIFSSTLFATNIELYLENGYFDSASHSKPLLNLWSLAVEEQYYLIWPVILLLIYRFKLNLLFSILFLLSLSLFFAFITRETFTFFMPHTRFWELSFGSLLAYVEIYRKQSFDKFLRKIFSQISQEELQNFKSIFGFAILALIMCHGRFSVLGALVAVFGSFLIISAGEDAWINRKILSNKIMLGIGLISYPLYLWHWPLLVLTKLYKDEVTHLDSFILLLLSFLFAYLTYVFIELKIRYKKTKITPIALLVIFFAIGLFGFSIYQKNGVMSRFSKGMEPIFQVKSSVEFMRYEKCFLSDKGQKAEEFVEECVEQGEGPLMFLWGDSHSSHLYPGLLEAQKHNHDFRIAQFNVGSCPPILNKKFEYLGNKFCKENNDYIFQKIMALRPEIVMLSFSLSALPIEDLKEIDATIKLLKKETFKVVLIGTVPLFDFYRHGGNFTKLLVKVYQKNNAIPQRNKDGLSDLSKEELLLKEIARMNGISYFSLLDLLCNEDGCILKIGNDLITNDGGHLTVAGSNLVAREILQNLREKKLLN